MPPLFFYGIMNSSQHFLKFWYLYIEALRGMVSEIDLNNEMILKYAKKIMGFAYSKTQNITDAEDLSQEILLSLSDSLKRQNNICDKDGFVFTICCYTWSKLSPCRPPVGTNQE